MDASGWSDRQDRSVLRLRTAERDDEPFLLHLFKTTRGEQLRAAGLPPAELDGLLAQQFRIQTSAYAARHPAAMSLLIERCREPVGRALLSCPHGCWHIVDIALLPSQQGQGIGTSVIDRIAAAASESGARSLTLAVLSTNQAARRLYRRLGFVDVDAGDGGAHLVMRKCLIGESVPPSPGET